MSEMNIKSTYKVGLPPGSLVHIGKKKAEQIKFELFEYNQKNYKSSEFTSADDCLQNLTLKDVTWLNINGLHDTQSIAAIGEKFKLHPLLLEDVLDTHQRPKFEDFENYLFISLKLLRLKENGKSFVTEQISLVLGVNWLLSFQEEQVDLFDDIQLRLKESKGNIRLKSSDYLLYRLIDTVVDNYFFVTDFLSDTISTVEEKVIKNPDESVMVEIQALKKQLNKFRKVVVPLRDVLSSIQKDETKIVDKFTLNYFRDVHDHIIQVIETIELQRESLSSLTDIYLSSISNKMNKIMQMLTIIATIFIPLTFIVGVYGMNFDNLPELHLKYGYFYVWGIMIGIILIMMRYFKRKKWL